MEVFFPAYYHQFQCLAAACPDSCCKEWTVDVDPESAAYYRTLPGALGDRLRAVLKDTSDGTVMEIEDGRCPMWRQDGLCRIHAELDHDALCQTCRDFPRLRHDYGDFVELGLELSCPEAARLILSAPRTEVFVQAQPGGSEPEYDTQCMEILLKSRKEALHFLDTSKHSIPHTLAAILLYAHSVQVALDGADLPDFQPEDCLKEAKSFQVDGDIQAILSLFTSLEILTEQWRSRLVSPADAIQWSEPLRAMARYMIQRYWLQSVCDYDLICRVKLMLVSCILVGALGGDPVQTAQLFSKEIENDPDNIDALLDSAYVSPALTDANLLGLLLK